MKKYQVGPAGYSEKYRPDLKILISNSYFSIGKEPIKVSRHEGRFWSCALVGYITIPRGAAFIKVNHIFREV